MLTVTTVFDPETRVLSYKEGSDRWAGTTEDNHSAQIVVEGIEALLDEYTAELVFGIPMYNNGVIYHPIGQIDAETQTYVLPNAILASARDGILPTELRLTKDSKVITSRNRLEISVVTAIDALRPFDGAYLPEIMGRSQEWAPDVQYAKGAVVIRDEVLYYSRRADNLGHDPKDGNISWWREVSVVAIQEYQTYIGDGVSTQFTVTHHMLSPDLQFTVSHNGTDLTGDVTDMTAIDENTASFTFSSPPPADTLLRINEAYRAISSPMWVWGMLESEEGMIAPEALFGMLEITDEKVTVRNGELGVNSSGRAYAGPEGLTKVLANEEDLTAHIIRTDNPHSVTKMQIGLERADNTTDMEKPVSHAVQALADTKANADEVVLKNPPISPGTHTKVTYDEDGLIVGGDNISGEDIPEHSADLLTSGTVSDERITHFVERIYRKTSAWTPVPSDDRYPTEKLVKDSLDLKADITEGVEAWSPSVSYSSGAITNVGGTLYASLISNNRGNDPDLSPDKWMKYTASSASDPALQDAYVTTIGDGVSTSITVTHSLDSEDVIVSLYSMAGDKPTIDSYVVRDNENQITIQFSVAPASNSVRVMVSRPGTSVRSVNGYQGDVILDPDDIGAVSSNHPITAGTKTKISYDTQGLVTVGEDLLASDIPNLNASKITAGTFDVARIPISKFVWTITGDGVTDEFTAAHLLGGSPLLIQMADSAGRIVDAAMEATATDLSVSMTTPPAVGTTYSITAIRW